MLRDLIIGAKYRASSGTPVNLTMADVTDVNDLQFIDSDILPAKHTLNIIEDRVARPATEDTLGTVKIGEGISVDEDGTISADYPDLILMDLYTYGVSWSVNVADPVINRVGNMEYHRSLPIQSKMRGCIALMKDGAKIMYYLDPNDWRWREEENAKENILSQQTLVVTDGVYTLTNDIFGDLRYELQWVKINDIACQVTSIDTATKTATLIPDSDIEAGTYDVQMGAVLNGYDGEVTVHIPEFWIKSWDGKELKEVRLAPAKFAKLDDTWEDLPEMLLSAYKDTVLNTVPANMGYLSTLPVNSAVSICNVHDYCRGGNNNTSYDQYLDSDKFRTILGKSRTNISRSNMRMCARNAGKEILSYSQYKRVLYWLWVVEYANFNSQAAFNSNLTHQGFHQGGLGEGVTSVGNTPWHYYNNNNPLTPCGYTNELGNGTGVIKMVVTMPETSGGDPTKSYTQNVSRWRGIENPFGDVWCNVDGCVVKYENTIIDGIKYNTCYITEDPSQYSDSDYKNWEQQYLLPLISGYIKEFNLSNNALIVLAAVGGSHNSYKCDYYYAGEQGPFTLLLGGDALHGVNAGLGSFRSSNGVGYAYASIGFRCSCIL